MGLHPQFALTNRHAIEAEIERLIDLLDTVDGPTEDLEPETDFCLAGDDGCARTWRMGVEYWGSNNDAADKLPVPMYGVDQSTPPLNQREMEVERRKLDDRESRRIDAEAAAWRRRQ